MHALERLVSLLAIAAAVSLSACDKESSGPPSQPPPAGGASSPGDAAVPAGDAAAPSAGDATPPGPGPTDPGAGATVLCTPDTRKGGVCTREYRPVCGSLEDATSRTFPNKCVACSDTKVVRYVDGPCPGDTTQ